MSDFLMILGVGTVIVVVLGFVGYMVTTNRIIKDQEQQISELNKRINLLEDERKYRDTNTQQY